ncbi:MAG TPA: bifunctional UDP-N-acetylmuramoyl-tripeptide:D-alanyl-D-alanine ligase/alanine racemase [Bacteroidaceae bacterium]|nr:bifunctional UDP-N-acetylmuramoyl-tripeptide:D-alanyl-D-alanine ligase/alanine racemase [Bacteroidaceae bacterium]
MTYTIEMLAEIMGANSHSLYPAKISWLLTDSRSLCFPEESLFFALIGERNDGHSYIRELHSRGVRNFVVSKLPEKIESLTDSNFLLVNNTLVALHRLAALHRNNFKIPVIGLTGSNGKTVIKEWLYQLLEPDYVVTRSPRSYNSQIGVPLSVWLMNQRTELAIIEAGISKPGEMRPLWKIIRPTIGVLSNIGEAHQENFSSLQEKCVEKIKLLQDCEVVVYDGDNDLIQDCINRTVASAREIAWSKKNREKPLYISRIEKKSDCTVISYRYIGLDSEYTIPFIDEASIENSLHCLAVALFLMVPIETIKERMLKLESIAMRLEVKEGKNGCVLINDSYNSDITSLDIALDFVARRYAGKESDRILILSDILQSGMAPKSLYRKVNQLIESRKIKKLIGIGRDISSVSEVFRIKEKFFFNTTDDFLKSATINEIKNVIVLIKGSRSFNFDSITEYMELKVHETILEVNLKSIVDNLNHYRSMLTPEVQIICMVKASAYGLGAVQVAKSLQDQGVDYLAVAVADEGWELRKAGILQNIMVMNPETTSFKTLFDQKLEPEIFSFYLLEELIKAAEHEGITNFPIHIKIDTGMHRLGFVPADVPQLIERLKRQSAVVPCSVFSHLAAGDNEKLDDFTKQQIELFESVAAQLQSQFKHTIFRHICNSSGIERFPYAHYDMVRLGLGLYGVNPLNNEPLNTVCSLKTTILQIRQLEKGDTVGYNRSEVLERPSLVAALPIGYADGLDRHLGNGNAYCIVNNKKAKYLGSICMDVCMIDVTDIDCKEGDSVEIFGENLPVQKLSDILGTIPYEILSTVSNRVKRVYYSE